MSNSALDIIPIRSKLKVALDWIWIAFKFALAYTFAVQGELFFYQGF